MALSTTDVEPIVTTINGALDLRNPRAEDINLEDIAHSLSGLNRYNGHSPVAFSVLQHLMLCYGIAESIGEDDETLLHILLHDAHEAYTGDIHKPMKALLDADGAITRLEKTLDEAIYDSVGIEPPSPDVKTEVKKYDYLALSAEVHTFWPQLVTSNRWAGLLEVKGSQIDLAFSTLNLSRRSVKQRWLKAVKELTE